MKTTLPFFLAASTILISTSAFAEFTGPNTKIALTQTGVNNKVQGDVFGANNKYTISQIGNDNVTTITGVNYYTPPFGPAPGIPAGKLKVGMADVNNSNFTVITQGNKNNITLSADRIAGFLGYVYPSSNNLNAYVKVVGNENTVSQSITDDKSSTSITITGDKNTVNSSYYQQGSRRAEVTGNSNYTLIDRNSSVSLRGNNNRLTAGDSATAHQQGDYNNISARGGSYQQTGNNNKIDSTVFAKEHNVNITTKQIGSNNKATVFEYYADAQNSTVALTNTGDTNETVVRFDGPYSYNSRTVSNNARIVSNLKGNNNKQQIYTTGSNVNIDVVGIAAARNNNNLTIDHNGDDGVVGIWMGGSNNTISSIQEGTKLNNKVQVYGDGNTIKQNQGTPYEVAIQNSALTTYITGNTNTVNASQGAGSNGNSVEAKLLNSNNNLATLTQDGSNNTLVANIMGNTNTLTAQQSGNQNRLSASITGNNNVLNATQSGNLNKMYASIGGTDNALTTSQSGSNNYMQVTLSGTGNSGTFTQTGSNKSLNVNYFGSNMKGITINQ